MTMVIMMASLNSILQLIGVTILFIIVLAITFLTTKIVGGIKINKDNRSNFKVIETYKIAPNKYLQIVKISEKYVVISISKDNIQFITELNDMKINEIEFAKLDMKFPDILNKIIKKEDNDQTKDH